jgi:hypothetical protein
MLTTATPITSAAELATAVPQMAATVLMIGEWLLKQHFSTQRATTPD